MATLTLLLETRKANKDSKYPLVFRIGANKKYAFISSGVHLFPSQFNTQKATIIGNAELNAKIKLQEADYLQKLHLLLLDNPHLDDPQEIKNKILEKPVHDITIKEFWEEHVATLNNSGRNGGARVYKMSLSVLSKNTNLSIPFSKFSYKDLLLLENKLYKNGMSANGIGVYMRSFRAICNKAINMDIIGYEWYPFRKFKIKKEKTTPRVLSIIEMRSYFNYPIQPTHLFYKSWLIGKLILMLRGINLKDLLLLSTKNIKGNRIIYKRAKTGKIYSVKITDEVEEVLKQFTPNNTLLGMLSNADLLDKEKLVNIHVQKRKVINSHLSKIGKMLEVNEPISTYVFRYSYANIAKQLGYSKDLIAEALGHEYGNSITGIYLEQFDLEIVDKMNDEIIKFTCKQVNK